MVKQLKSILLNDPSRILFFLFGFWEIFKLKINNRVKISRGLNIIASPIIDIRRGCKLRIGERVTLNSRNRGYHINLYGPVKLFADYPGAIIVIGDDTRIHGSCIHACLSIAIGKRCLIAANCHIIDSNGHEVCFEEPSARIHSKDTPREVVIENDVWIGANSIILPGTHIGSGSVIGANSVVRGVVPPKVLVAGNPAKIINKLGE